MEIEKFRDCIIQIRARIPENEEDCIALAKEKNMKEDEKNKVEMQKKLIKEKNIINKNIIMNKNNNHTNNHISNSKNKKRIFKLPNILKLKRSNNEKAKGKKK